MKRRTFLRNTLPATIAMPGLLNGFSFNAFAAAPDNALSSVAGPNATNDRILVLIQLTGGNDGLNTVVPLDIYGHYYNARANVAIPQSKVLRLNGTEKTGLHPAMTDLQNLYNSGKASIVQSVGYENPSFSHFRARDIWMTGDNSSNRPVTKTGWMGRYIESEYPDYPDAYPNADMPHPLAIQISNVPSIAVQGPLLSMGLSITDPDRIYNFTNPFHDYPFSSTAANKELRYIRVISEKTKTYSDIIRSAYHSANNQASYPNTSLAKQLGIVARLIRGGLKTRVFTVTLDGFDTHKKQTNSGDTTTGNHAKLLSELSTGIAAFQKDMELMGLDDRVLGMTFSEFGRRIKSNASMGTDHGTAAPMVLFGKHVKNGVLGESPIIPADTQAGTNISFQYDFRSVYASVLEKWFCVKQPLLDTLLYEHYQSLPLIKGGPCGGTDSIDDVNNQSQDLVLKMWPSPYHITATLQFSSTGGYTLIQQITSAGQLVRVLAQGDYAKGVHTVDIYNDGLAPGIYYIRLQNQSLQKIISVMKM